MTNAPFIAELTLAVDAASGDDEAARALGRSHILLMRVCQVATSSTISAYERSDAIVALALEIMDQVEANRRALWLAQMAVPFVRATTTGDMDEGQ